MATIELNGIMGLQVRLAMLRSIRDAGRGLYTSAPGPEEAHGILARLAVLDNDIEDLGRQIEAVCRLN